jgi:hypothetical protein
VPRHRVLDVLRLVHVTRQHETHTTVTSPRTGTSPDSGKRCSVR